MGSPSTSRRRPPSPAALPAVVGAGVIGVVGALGLVGCGSSEPGGSAASSCAAVLERAGAVYLGQGGARRDPELTGRTVPAVLPGCDDTGSGASDDPAAHDTRVDAAEIAGVDLATAVYVDGVVYVREGRELPAAARR